MRMQQFALPATAFLLFGALFWIIPAMVAEFGQRRGIVAVLLMYWFGFCLPLGLVFGGARGRLWRGGVPWLAVALALGLAAVVWLRHPCGFALPVVGLALAAALTNGPLEELYWRGAWGRVFPDSPAMQALGLALFGAWHVPLVLMSGLPFPGGVWGLPVAALAAGAFWAWLARRHGLGWAMASHAATNAVLFLPLIAAGFPRLTG